MISQSAKIRVHGHRGARARLPENTLPAFEYAIAAGVGALELDVAITRDRVVVVSHDPYLEPPICSGPQPKAAIYDLTLAEVRQWDCGKLPNPAFPNQTPVPGTRMPTLDEVLALAPAGQFQFHIEAKTFSEHPELSPAPEEFAQLVLSTIRTHGLEKRVMFLSFDFRSLHAMKNLAPELGLVALWEGDNRSFTSVAKDAGSSVVSPLYTLVNPEKVRDAHAAGIEIIPWTVNAPADWDRMIAAQVDAIVTDDPAELIAYLRQKEVAGHGPAPPGS